MVCETLVVKAGLIYGSISKWFENFYTSLVYQRCVFFHVAGVLVSDGRVAWRVCESPKHRYKTV